LCQLTEKAVGIQGEKFARGQLRSYMRTPVAYYVAQLYSQIGLPCIVLGTGNLDEDGYLYYFCKAGDGVADVQLIADLHKSEVFQVAALLNVPKSVLEAPPR
jgi:NAD+ synthase (glutamine-hydrolysing)